MIKILHSYYPSFLLAQGSNGYSSLCTWASTAPAGEAYKVQWVWSDDEDVHVANHLDWFITYLLSLSSIRVSVLKWIPRELKMPVPFG